MWKRIVCTITVAAGIVAATPIALAEPNRPVAAESRADKSRPADRDASRDAGSDRDRYAERDRADDKTDKFEGGNMIVIAVSTTTLLLGLLFLAILL